MRVTQPIRDLLSLGFASTIAQVVLLREAMTTLGGTEIAWGFVLSLWLAGIALGARLGVRFGNPRAAGLLPHLVLVLAAVGTVLFRAAPALIGAAPGEITAMVPTVCIWTAAILPGAIAGGLCFPIFAGGVNDSGRAYSWEATGALFGGLFFTGITASSGAATTLLFSAIVVLALSTLNRFVVVALALILLSISGTAESQLSKLSWMWSQHPGALKIATETRHQRIEVSRSLPTTLYANGRLIATYPDNYLTIPRTHLIMLLHPDPQRVFATNSLADGSLITILRHPIAELTVVEEDPAFPELLTNWYDQDFRNALADPRVSVSTTDPIRAINVVSEIDLIISLGDMPSSLRLNRLWTREYFETCLDHLSQDGVLVLRLAVSDTYLGGGSGRLFDIIASTLSSVFEEVRAIPGEQILFVASNHTIDFDVLEHRYAKRGIVDPAFVPEMIETLLDRDRIASLEARLQSSDRAINKLMHPRAVLLASGLAESTSTTSMLTAAMALNNARPTWLVVLFVACLVGCLLLVRAPGPVYAISATIVGAGSMTWWLLLLAIWQTVRGSVYAEIGGLTALFMAGLAFGARAEITPHFHKASLPLIFTSSAALSLATMLGVPTWQTLITVPLLLLTGGLLTGTAFPCLAALMSQDNVRRGSGLTFAADELGAALAAILVGLIAIPWIGIAATAAGLAALQIAIIPAILVVEINP